MRILKNVLKSNLAVASAQSIHNFSTVFYQPWKRLCTKTEHPSPPASASSQADLSTDPISPSGTGLAYGKLHGATKYMLKTDVINLLEGSKLTTDDIKVSYNRTFVPLGMLIQFSSYSAYENAFKMIAKKGRLFRLDRIDRSQWDVVLPYNGKTILMEGIPRSAVPEDIERFLCGCVYDASSINLFVRAGSPEPMKVALVRFFSQTEAMNTFVMKNRSCCLNNQISLRVLQ